LSRIGVDVEDTDNEEVTRWHPRTSLKYEVDANWAWSNENNDNRLYGLLAALIVILCAGCGAPLLGAASGVEGSSAASTAATDMISNPSMFDYTTDSTKIPFLTPAALASGNRLTEGYVVRQQCYFRTADPLFFVPDELQQPSWDFAGRLDATDHFEALEYRNALTLGLTDGKARLNTWPVELVSFSDMTAIFLRQRLAMLPASDQHQLFEDFVERSQRIQQVVTRLEADYDPALACPGPSH
jgi:hypothetical protein